MSPKEYGWFVELPPQAVSKLDAISKGLKFYMPMQPCHWGHMAVRSVNRGCLQCRAEGAANGTGRKDYPSKRQAVLSARRKERLKKEVAAYQEVRSRVTPSWANQEKIKAVYAEAKRLGMAVDHIIPLRGKTVCGLHVENNLQLLPPLQNTLKGNRFDPDELSYGKGCKHEKPSS